MGVLYHKKIKYTGGSRDVNAVHWNDNAILGAKNLLPNNAKSQTINGVTFTVNSDGSVTVNGTASAWTDLLINRPFYLTNGNYIFSIGDANLPTDAVVLVYGRANGSWTLLAELNSGSVSFIASSTYEYYSIQLGIDSGVAINNATIYPMIRLASITDDTYQPYAETNLQLTQNKLSQSDYAKTGAVNYLENKASTLTVNGITFTVNSDKSVTANGTATDTAEITLNGGSGIAILPAKNYRLRGCPANGSSGGYRLFVKLMDNSYIIDLGEGANIPSISAVTYVRIVIYSGKTVNNLTFYPMITETDYTGPYAPYAKTNRELTNALTLTTTVHTVETSNDLEWKYAGTRGNDYMVSFAGFVVLKRDATTNENAWIKIGTLSKTCTWWAQFSSPFMAGTGTGLASSIQITPSGDINFNMRVGMKSGDQYHVMGTIVL